MTQVRRLNRAALACLAAGAAWSQAGADVTHKSYASKNSFHYEVVGLGDLDQKRAGLPDNGAYHCVPSSFMDMAIYFANHGDPHIGFPFPVLPDVPWEYPDYYDFGTFHVEHLGGLMDTDGGTSPGDALDGWQSFLHTKPYFTVAYTADGDWAPRLHKLAHVAACGAYVIPRVGWYDVSDYPEIERDGGHAIALARAQTINGQRIFGIRDPADSDGLNSQSWFATTLYDTQDEFVEADGDWRWMTRVLGYGGTKKGYIYGYYAIWPLFVLSTDGPTIVRTNAFRLIDSLQPERIEFNGANGAAILDMVVGGEPDEVFYLTDNVAGQVRALWSLGLGTGESRHVEDLRSATDLVSGNNRRVYVIDGTRVKCVNPDEDVEEAVEADILPPAPCDAIAFDDKARKVILYSRAGGEIYRFGLSLDGEPSAEKIPGGILPYAPAAMAMNPMDGSLWMVFDESDSIFGIVPDGNGGTMAQVFSEDGIEDPTDLTFDDEGRMIVNTGGRLRVFEGGGAAPWVLADGSVLQGLEVGRLMTIPCIRTNIDLSLPPDPRDLDVLPDQFGGETAQDCRIDLTYDGRVDSDDFIAFLTAFSEATPAADLGGSGLPCGEGDGHVDTDDFICFLILFSAGCK